MITKVMSGTNPGEFYLVCLSTDSKPTDVPNGTFAIEMDTKKMYAFDEAGDTWYEQ